MKEWLDAIGAAGPIVLMLGAMIWALIVFHGDSRWARRPEVFDEHGEVKWAPKSVVSTVLGQNDNIADHESRLERLEEREETILKEIRSQLQTLGAKMDDVRDRCTRLEAQAEARRRTDAESRGQPRDT